MSENIQAQLTIESDLMAVLGDKMYRQHPVVVLARELVQNATDACKRKGLPPSAWDVSLDISATDKGFTVTCTDNGVGMTSEQIMADLLHIGKRKTNQDGQTGGFGLAKVAIMRNPGWEVRSLGNTLRDDLVIQTGQTQIAGTVVTVMSDRATSFDDIKRAVAMIAFSDYDIHVSVSWNGNPVVDDQHLGLRAKRGDDHREDAWTGFVCEQIKVGTFEFNGWNAYRINGLCQWFDNSWSGRKPNAIVDVDVASISPHDQKYPLNTGRDGFNDWSLQRKVSDWVNSLDVDKNTTAKKLEEQTRPEKPRQVIFKGDAIDPVFKLAYMPSFSSSARSGRACRSVVTAKTVAGFARLDISYDRNNVPSSELKAHDRLLVAWAKIVAHVAREPFGIGYTTEAEASRVTIGDGLAYYLINPEAVRGMASTTGLGLRLWHLATHEAAHQTCDVHNEDFTSKMAELGRETADLVASALDNCRGDLMSVIHGLK